MKLQEIEFNLDGHEHIELKNLLKVTNLCATGGQAKEVIEAGEVQVDGVVETRKAFKLFTGQTLSYNGHRITIAG